MAQVALNSQGRWRCINAYDLIANKYVFIIEDESGNTQFLGDFDCRAAGKAAFIEWVKEQQRAYITER